MTFKNIRIKMKGGKSRMQRVKVLASGKYKFVKNIKKSSSSKPKKSTPKSKKSKSKTGKGGKRMGKSIQQTAFKWLRIGALAAPAVYAYQHPFNNDPKYRLIDGVKYYTGYNLETGVFDWNDLAKGWGAFLGATVATYGIPKIAGILRKL